MRRLREAAAFLALAVGPGAWSSGAEVAECLRVLERSGFDGPLIIENYVWREVGTRPLDELARARDFIRASLGRKD